MKWINIQWCMDCCSQVQTYGLDEECQCGEEE